MTDRLASRSTMTRTTARTFCLLLAGLGVLSLLAAPTRTWPRFPFPLGAVLLGTAGWLRRIRRSRSQGPISRPHSSEVLP